jgi:hypothetical protein
VAPDRPAGVDAQDRVPDPWTRVEVRRPGRIRLTTAFSLARVGATAPRCTG